VAEPPHGLPFSQLALGVVCPMANEAETAAVFVDAVLAECARYAFRVVAFYAVVDRASRDDTRAVLEGHAALRPELRVVWAPETRGVADAYVRGYREALAAGTDLVLEIDAGFSHAPADIPRFLDAFAAGADCVFGTRFGAGGRNLAARRRRVVSRGGTMLANFLLGTTLTDMTSGFELFSSGALEHVLERGIRSKGPFFQTEIKAHCGGLRVAEVPITYTAGSHRLGWHAVAESLRNLAWLFVERTGRRWR